MSVSIIQWLNCLMHGHSFVNDRGKFRYRIMHKHGNKFYIIPCLNCKGEVWRRELP